MPEQLTPERRKYAFTRIGRLTAKLERTEAAIRSLAAPPVSEADNINIKGLMKVRRSTLNSLKRWQKEIGETSHV